MAAPKGKSLQSPILEVPAGLGVNRERRAQQARQCNGTSGHEPDRGEVVLHKASLQGVILGFSAARLDEWEPFGRISLGTCT